MKYRVKLHMRDAEEAKYTKDYVMIEEGPVSIKLWEAEDEWNVVPLSAIYFYNVQMIED